jgi:hypothetical protein
MAIFSRFNLQWNTGAQPGAACLRRSLLDERVSLYTAGTIHEAYASYFTGADFVPVEH